ncbi:MAG TPA: pyrroline-5-carboxylate reductase, partial [Steroidobacteraceae bacterium]|nr:pyrroline-5-carboxylate reductase [Steroidobacteraceae bacterium]
MTPAKTVSINMISERLAFLGGGNMGRALIGGLLQRNTRPELITVGEAYEPARSALGKDFGVFATADNAAAIADAGIVVLAVKPQDAGAVLAPLAPILQRTRPVVVSICAGLRVSALEEWCGGGISIVRSMPNRPALVGAGATGLYAGPGVSDTHRAKAEAVMSAVGVVVWVPTEDTLDVVTALSGSGPAYFFLLAESMVQAAVDLGLEPDAARRLAVATLHGAGLLAHSGDGDLA